MAEPGGLRAGRALAPNAHPRGLSGSPRSHGNGPSPGRPNEASKARAGGGAWSGTELRRASSRGRGTGAAALPRAAFSSPNHVSVIAGAKHAYAGGRRGRLIPRAHRTPHPARSSCLSQPATTDTAG